MPQKERVKPPGARDMANDFVPVHVAPNACCGTETYNDAMDCCVEEDGRKKVKRNQVCEASEEEEGSDERYVAYAIQAYAKIILNSFSGLRSKVTVVKIECPRT